MSLNRRAPQRDANERVIIDTLRKAGYLVVQLSAPGVPDLVVIKPERDIPVHTVRSPEEALQAATAPITLLEVKGQGEKLNPLQRAWHDQAKGHYGL